MKRLFTTNVFKALSFSLAISVFSATFGQNLFAQEYSDEDTSTNQISSNEEEENNQDEYEGDYYEDEEVRLTQNGAGDQFISLKMMPLFPLNFGGQLFVGGGISIGYHRFISQYVALGADVMFGYNTTIGSNIFTVIPFTVGVTFQPYIKRFEFPITLNVGAAIENYLQYNYFPGLVLKGDVGAFFRMNENWSFGLEGQFLYLPQWYVKTPEKNDVYFGIAASLCARYHF